MKDILDETRINIYNFLNKIKEDDINYIINIIRKNTGILYITGVGKSGIAAMYFSDMLKSFSYRSSYLNPLNSLHGDLGILRKEDTIIFLSKSGTTREIVNLIKLAREKNIKLISIFNTEDIKNNTDFSIVLPSKEDKDVLSNIIPIDSFLNYIIFFNIVLSILKKNITLEEYKKNHPF